MYITKVKKLNRLRLLYWYYYTKDEYDSEEED